MNDFTIVTDSSCDLPDALATKMGVTVLPLSLSLDGKEYRNLLDGSEISPTSFYAQLREGKACTTSAVNVEAFIGVFEPLLKAGRDVLCLAFSSGLSATYSAAQIAVDELAEKYPARKIFAVDTLCASLGQGLLVYLAAQRAKDGLGITEVHAFVERTKLRVCHWFTVEDLNFLKRGGRVSGAAAMFGTMLGIKPVMHVDNDGHLIPMEKVRGRKASLQALVDHLVLTADHPTAQTVFLSHGDSAEDAAYVEGLLRDLGIKTVIVNYVGPVIGAHSGPGTMALFFLGTMR